MAKLTKQDIQNIVEDLKKICPIYHVSFEERDDLITEFVHYYFDRFSVVIIKKTTQGKKILAGTKKLTDKEAVEYLWQFKDKLKEKKLYLSDDKTLNLLDKKIRNDLLFRVESIMQSREERRKYLTCVYFGFGNIKVVE